MDAVNSSVGAVESDVAILLEAPPVASRRERFGRWALLVAAIALVCVVAVRNIHRGEFDYYVDEAQHGVTGLFMADALRDFPVTHPLQYAYTYYAQYPAVAILHWPPLFYVFEGLSFLLLGPSAMAARLAVLLFTVVLLYQWFRLVEELQDSFTAAVSTAVLGLLPMVMVFEKTVMLEIPSLALSVAAIRYWIRYLEQGGRGPLVGFALWLSAALLCKQTSVYLLLFCALTLVVTGKWDRLFTRDMALAAGAVAVLAGPVLALMLLVQGKAVANDLGSHRMAGWERLSYYIVTLPKAFSGFLFVLAVLGVALSWRWDKRERTLIMLCWIVAGYATFTFFAQREARFAVYWFPPMVYFAVGLLTQFFRVHRLRTVMRTAALGLVGILAVPAWSQQRPYISGYRDVAARLIGQYHTGIVLFEGRVPGNFVFYMRALDPDRRFLVLRKVLYTDDIRPGGSSEELVHSREDLAEVFQKDGIRFVVISENFPARFPVQRYLKELLSTEQFQLLGRFPIESNEPQWAAQSLLLYENKQWAPPTDPMLKIRMLTLPHDIEVPFSKFEAGKH